MGNGGILTPFGTVGVDTLIAKARKSENAKVSDGSLVVNFPMELFDDQIQ